VALLWNQRALWSRVPKSRLWLKESWVWVRFRRILSLQSLEDRKHLGKLMDPSLSLIFLSAWQWLTLRALANKIKRRSSRAISCQRSPSAATASTYQSATTEAGVFFSSREWTRTNKSALITVWNFKLTINKLTISQIKRSQIWSHKLFGSNSLQSNASSRATRELSNFGRSGSINNTRLSQLNDFTRLMGLCFLVE